MFLAIFVLIALTCVPCRNRASYTFQVTPGKMICRKPVTRPWKTDYG
jgi:hypothetical protein